MSNIVKQNTLRAYLYMAFLTLFITLLGYLISTTFNFGLSGTGVFLIIAGVINFVAYFYSDRLIIAASHAKTLTYDQAPEYVSIVEKLCKESHLPMPRLYYLDEDAMNAFATGRDPKHAAVVATKGLLEKLTPNEIKGVIAHELSHVKSLDTRLMAITAILAGLISILADIYWRSQLIGKASEKDRSGVLAILGLILAAIAPLSAMFIQLAISRRREYAADASGAQIVRNPSFLVSALQKISRDQLPLPSASPATAHLYISNPFKSEGLIEKMFSTHPPIEDRIKILTNMK